MPTTALHAAAANGHLSIVKLLLKKRANPSARDQNGRIPADLARNAGYNEVADYLDRVVETRARVVKAVARREERKLEFVPNPVGAADVGRVLWAHGVPPTVAQPKFVKNYNAAVAAHSEVARVAAAHRRERHNLIVEAPLHFSDCGDGDE